MRIVVLDGHTLNPGDLSWGPLEALGDCEIYERTHSDETVLRSQDSEIILTNKTVLDKDTISQLPNLRYIGVLATGYDVVDIDAARRHGVAVTNVPEYGTGSVTQMVFAHILHLYNHVAEHSVSVREGGWSRSKDFCYWEFPLVELQGKTLGIIGLGRIGSSVATAALALGMQVLAHDRFVPSNVPDGVVLRGLEDVFKESDVVSLHCPLTEHNRGFVNAELLGRMKKSAILINTSRGPLVNEEELAEALNKGTIAGVGLDVLSSEPPSLDNPLLSAANCCITPHIAWATRGARQRLMDKVIENVRAFIAGNPVNLVINGPEYSG